MQSLDQFQAERQLEQFSELLEGGRLKLVRRMLNALHPGEVAHLLESTPSNRRKLVWSLIDSDLSGEVLVELGDQVRSSLIEGMHPRELIVAAEGMETDDLADLIQDLPETVTSEILKLMDHQDRKRLEAVLAFEEDTAGGLMNTDTVTVRADVSVEVVLRYLRLRGHLPSHTSHLIVVDRYEVYQGVVRMEALVTSDVDLLVASVMQKEIPAISADTPSTDVAKIFAKRDLISAAVVDANGRLLGRITVDDVVDIIRDEAEHHLMSRGGLNEEDDIFSPVINSSKRRAIWLGVNLMTAFLASWVISQFQVTLEKVVALAVLMPIVASMGGVAGTQTLTLVIRGIALDQVGKKNINWLLFKEISVGFINGLFWAAIVAGITIFWFGSVQIGAIIAAAMVVNLLFAALAGVLIPIVMQSLSIDPALAGGVVLTTVTDVIGFVTFLGLATLILL